jgi:hypothetical protein
MKHFLGVQLLASRVRAPVLSSALRCPLDSGLFHGDLLRFEIEVLVDQSDQSDRACHVTPIRQHSRLSLMLSIDQQ